MRAKTLSSSNFADFLFSVSQESFSKIQDFGRKSFLSKTPKFNLPFSPKILLAVIGIIVFIAVVALFRTNQNSSATVSSEKPIAPLAKETQVVNKVFNFPIKNSAGKEVSKIKYEILSVNLQDEILVKGQRARSVQGRNFLIVNLKISNSFNQGIQINSRDYIRLVINGNKNELLAADIHNDPVEVQAISTKTTRIGFPINETDTNLDIQVGEINGKKEIIKVNFE